MRDFVSRLLVLAVLLLLLPSFSSPALADAQGGKVLLIVAPSDFEATEYTNTRKVLEAAGATCTVASTKVGSLKSNKNLRVQSDLALEDVRTADYDAVVVIGGNGIKRLWHNAQAHRVVREAAEQGKVVAAICAAPGVLANAGVMKGRKGTANAKSGAGGELEGNGCEYTRTNVEVDGKFVTANGPKAATSFGEAIAAAL
ncbi:MAG: DJ-1/PfpI family protein [Pseudodesulfovibrio sp.]|uniref:DJ-1/PfpI family protein n=1 Tax=Pseudodesulfovibrio sp. TaxID=2035812 RepID=UPI003D0D12CB